MQLFTLILFVLFYFVFYQGIPAQLPTLLRATSDFRLEQRRLLSSFNTDSDLVKFNQLKVGL